MGTMLHLQRRLCPLFRVLQDADDIVLHLVNRAIPLTPRPIARTAIDVPADILARYVGDYQFLRQFTITMTLRVTLKTASSYGDKPCPGDEHGCCV
jgi:hypothetical protein